MYQIIDRTEMKSLLRIGKVFGINPFHLSLCLWLFLSLFLVCHAGISEPLDTTDAIKLSGNHPNPSDDSNSRPSESRDGGGNIAQIKERRRKQRELQQQKLLAENNPQEYESEHFFAGKRHHPPQEQERNEEHDRGRKQKDVQKQQLFAEDDPQEYESERLMADKRRHPPQEQELNEERDRRRKQRNLQQGQLLAEQNESEQQLQHHPPHQQKLNRGHHDSEPLLNTNAKVEILEPPEGSYVKGGNFHVKVNIRPEDEDDFREAFEDNDNAKVCLSLDDGPWHCWPVMNGRIYFANAVEGSHTIVGKLYTDGNLREDSTSSTVTFTNIYDPDITMFDSTDEESNIEDAQNQRRLDNQEKEEQVTIDVPILDLQSPAEKVTYPGSSVTIQTSLYPKDPELFEILFLYAFVCVNIDASTAHACFAIYGDNSFTVIVLDLEPGLHTIEAALSHPDTGDLILESSPGVKLFYTSGEDNEEAFIEAEIQVDGKPRFIPVVRGGDLESQTKAFCRSIGMEHNAECNELVLERLSKAWDEKMMLSGNIDEVED